MTNNQTPSTAPLTDDERNRKSRKRKAILASGAVLGIGAVVTLAAWNDTVFGSGEFGIGNTAWNVQGSTVSSTAGFLEYATSPEAGAISFSATPINALHLMPGQTTEGKFWLKETKGNLDALVTIQAPTITPAVNSLADVLEVTITDGTTDYVANKKLSLQGASTVITVPAGQTKELTFRVTLPAGANPNAISNTTAQATWQMTAQSEEA